MGVGTGEQRGGSRLLSSATPMRELAVQRGLRRQYARKCAPAAAAAGPTTLSPCTHRHDRPVHGHHDAQEGRQGPAGGQAGQRAGRGADDGEEDAHEARAQTARACARDRRTTRRHGQGGCWTVPGEERAEGAWSGSQLVFGLELSTTCASVCGDPASCMMTSGCTPTRGSSQPACGIRREVTQCSCQEHSGLLASGLHLPWPSRTRKHWRQPALLRAGVLRPR